MGEMTTELPASLREQVASLFRDRAPVLVEVRFPRMGTSSDWYLFDTVDQLERLRRSSAAALKFTWPARGTSSSDPAN